jgi:predicted porin
LLLSTSSTSVCVQPSPTCRPKVKTWLACQLGTFSGGDADLAKFIQVGTTYYFNKNFNVWADYYINLLDENTDYAKAVGLNGNDDMAAVV